MKLFCTTLVLLLYQIGFAQEEPVQKKEFNFFKAENRIFGAELTLSTFGAGPGLFMQFNNKLKIKTSFNYFFYDYSLQKLVSDLQGIAKIRVGGIGVFADYHFLKYFYATTGLSTNFNKIDVAGKMANSILIGDVEMTPDAIGEVGIKIEPAWAFSPYIGMGFGRFISNQHKFGFNLEIGSFFQGPPSVDLFARGMLEPTASEEQEKLMEQNIKPLDFWPKIALNISYRIQ